jgi:hypothetical protein
MGCGFFRWKNARLFMVQDKLPITKTPNFLEFFIKVICYISSIAMKLQLNVLDNQSILLCKKTTSNIPYALH